ncbi:UvrD-helicase domain-containing protein, partial [bacterium]
MKFIADFHIHSHYSIATSKKLIPEYLDYWAQLKGIDVVGTGDCVHPGWLAELKEKLEPADNGLYRLKKQYKLKEPEVYLPQKTKRDVYFMLTGELSSIYKKNGKVRKIHNLCVFPDFESVVKLQTPLSNLGNITSDGRPILGIDAKHILEMTLNSSRKSFVIPAHIWTPWFSVLGSKSGFNTLEECYEDLTQYIFAVETGLSSDPPMNWACSFLDKFQLVSNSDAHSPEKLGREANLFDTEIGFDSIYNALKNDKGFLGTIEFFPQEGKYHYDGHRKCNVCWDPLTTIQNNGICSVCDTPVTKGVMYRVAELADRSNILEAKNRKNFYSITSLPDIISEIVGKKPNTLTVKKEYFRILEKIGPDLHTLLFSDIKEIKKSGSAVLAKAIQRMRESNVYIKQGFDGEFGHITAFTDEEKNKITSSSLFDSNDTHEQKEVDEQHRYSIKFDIQSFQNFKEKKKEEKIETAVKNIAIYPVPNKQNSAIEHVEGQCMIISGPGSGKTHVLTERIIHLIEKHSVNPLNILAVTFSNKAAEEIRARIKQKIDSKKITVSTFHSLGLSILKKHCDEFNRSHPFILLDENEKKTLLEKVSNKKITKKILSSISNYKQGIEQDENILGILEAYNKALQEINAFDIDDLIHLPVKILRRHADILKKYRKRFNWILIDEFQDINSIQYQLIKLLAEPKNPNLFVIGDPDQSIYGFRGSSVDYINNFPNDFPNTKIIHLEKSYRCPDTVLQMAGQALRKKDKLNGKKDTIKIHVTQCETDKSEADLIAGQIDKLLGGVRSYSIHSGASDGSSDSSIKSFSDIAVLCRTTVMFPHIIKSLEKHGIAYQVIGAQPFYKTEPYYLLFKYFKNVYYKITKGVILQDMPKDIYNKIYLLIEEKKNISVILAHLIQDEDIHAEHKKRFINLGQQFGNDYASFLSQLALKKEIDDYNIDNQAVSVMTMHA